MEVEGRLEVEEESMTGWCQVRRKGGQVEKDVAAVSRGWEEYKRKFPHLAFAQREEWSEREVVKMWLAEETSRRWRGGRRGVSQRMEGPTCDRWSGG